MSKLIEMCRKFHQEEYGTAEDSPYRDHAPFDIEGLSLFAADCGGYDITGEVELKITNNKIEIIFSDYEEIAPGRNDWVPKHRFELIESGCPSN